MINLRNVVKNIIQDLRGVFLHTPTCPFCQREIRRSDAIDPYLWARVSWVDAHRDCVEKQKRREHLQADSLWNAITDGSIGDR